MTKPKVTDEVAGQVYETVLGECLVKKVVDFALPGKEIKPERRRIYKAFIREAMKLVKP